MPFVDKVYWITDVNGKRHLKNVKELVHPTEEELHKQAKMKLFYDKHGDAMRRLAQSPEHDQ